MLRGADRVIFTKLHIKGAYRTPYSGWYKFKSGGYGREVIAELYGELGYKVGAEIGVMNGEFSRIICDATPSMKLFCVDPYTPWPGSRVSQERQEVRFRSAQKRLSGFEATFLRKTSMEALADIPDGSLDFVYIDALHDFDNVMQDLIHWNRKVRRGGMISGHDYVLLHDCGVVPAVNAYTWAHNINHWYITNEYLSSFFWVKA
jgi:hypothetical protein